MTTLPSGLRTGAHAVDTRSGSDIIVTYRNFGELDVWGSDLGAELLLDRGFSLEGTFSYVNKDFFPKEEVGGVQDISLNAPGKKGSLAVRYRNEGNGLSGELRARCRKRASPARAPERIRAARPRDLCNRSASSRSTGLR